jgi:hypothetical protein
MKQRHRNPRLKFQLKLLCLCFAAASCPAADLPDAPTAQRDIPFDQEFEEGIRRPRSEAPRRSAIVDWKPIVNQTFALLTMEQGFRMVQPKTRDHLGGRFFADWFACVGNLHGWNDGDSAFTNYIGHPIHSSWAAYIEIHNDALGRNLEFENSGRYWGSRLRALAWAELYEIQWHIGPISEASIGHVGRPGTHTLGYVNLVTSAPGGFGWVVLEDWLDRRIVRRQEAGTVDLSKRRVYRMLLNPSKAVANLLRIKKPWFRDSRPIDWVPESMQGKD